MRVMALLIVAGLVAGFRVTADDRPTVDYSDWNQVLKQTVMPTGRSDRIPAPLIKSLPGTRVTHANPNPSRLEGNRVFFHALSAGNIDYVRRIRDSLSRLPDTFPLAGLSRDEQLAYWLNLHNVTVYLALAEQYPETGLEDFYRDTWHKPLVTVAGQALSLADIERQVVADWADPVVIYGFYSGAIGGPNLRREAYTGATVRAALEDNARDFVGSIRGVQFHGDTAHVSELYALARPLFPDFEAGLKRHLQAYADPQLMARLESADRFVADRYDWYIADLYNGHLGLGGAANTNPAALILALTAPGNTNNPNFINWMIASTTASKFPPHVRQFLVDLATRNSRMGTPAVTIEDVTEAETEDR